MMILASMWSDNTNGAGSVPSLSVSFMRIYGALKSLHEKPS